MPVDKKSCAGEMINGFPSWDAVDGAAAEFPMDDNHNTSGAVQCAFVGVWTSEVVGGGLAGPEVHCPLELDEEESKAVAERIYAPLSKMFTAAGLNKKVKTENYVTFGGNIRALNAHAIALESEHIAALSASSNPMKAIIAHANKEQRFQCSDTPGAFKAGGTAFCTLQALQRANCEAVRRCAPKEAGLTRRSLMSVQVNFAGRQETVISPIGWFDTIVAGRPPNLRCNEGNSVFEANPPNAGTQVWRNTKDNSGDTTFGTGSRVSCPGAKDQAFCCGVFGAQNQRVKQCGAGRTFIGIGSFFKDLAHNPPDAASLAPEWGNDESIEDILHELCCDEAGNLDPGTVNINNNRTRDNEPDSYAIKLIHLNSTKALATLTQANLQALSDWTKLPENNINLAGGIPFDPAKGSVADFYKTIPDITTRMLFAKMAYRMGIKNHVEQDGIGGLRGGNSAYVYTCGAPHYYLRPNFFPKGDAGYKWSRIRYRTGYTQPEIKAAYHIILEENLNEQNMDPGYVCLRNFEVQAREEFIEYINNQPQFADFGISINEDGVISVPAYVAPRRYTCEVNIGRKPVDNQGNGLDVELTTKRLFMNIQFTQTDVYIWVPTPTAEDPNKHFGNQPPTSVTNKSAKDKELGNHYWSLPLKFHVMYNENSVRGEQYKNLNGQTSLDHYCQQGTKTAVTGSTGHQEGKPGFAWPKLLVCANKCGSIPKYEAADASCDDISDQFGCSDKGAQKSRPASKIYGPPFAYMPVIMGMPVIKYRLQVGLSSDVAKCQGIGDGKGWILKYERGKFDPLLLGDGAAGSEVATPYRTTQYRDYEERHSVCHILAEADRVVATYGKNEGDSNCMNMLRSFDTKAECEGAKAAKTDVTAPYADIFENVVLIRNAIQQNVGKVDGAINTLMGQIAGAIDEICPIDYGDLDEGEIADCKSNLYIVLTPIRDGFVFKDTIAKGTALFNAKET